MDTTSHPTFEAWVRGILAEVRAHKPCRVLRDDGWYPKQLRFLVTDANDTWGAEAWASHTLSVECAKTYVGENRRFLRTVNNRNLLGFLLQHEVDVTRPIRDAHYAGVIVPTIRMDVPCWTLDGLEQKEGVRRYIGPARELVEVRNYRFHKLVCGGDAQTLRNFLECAGELTALPSIASPFVVWVPGPVPSSV